MKYDSSYFIPKSCCFSFLGLTFCINYNLTPSDLVSSWEVYYLNRLAILVLWCLLHVELGIEFFTDLVEKLFSDLLISELKLAGTWLY